MYYDVDRNGIVFPYYYGNYFCGAQTRYIKPRDLGDGELHKIDTLPGTRLGLLFYGWNQEKFIGNVKAVVVVEGAFNAISITQALNKAYGGFSNNTWRAVACSGANISEHHKESLQQLKQQGYKIIAAPDSDEAGLKMLNKLIESDTATHFALTEDDEKDWNDMIKEKGHEEFARWFLKQIAKIDR
jgi:DNA primase